MEGGFRYPIGTLPDRQSRPVQPSAIPRLTDSETCGLPGESGDRLFDALSLLASEETVKGVYYVYIVTCPAD